MVGKPLCHLRLSVAVECERARAEGDSPRGAVFIGDDAGIQNVKRPISFRNERRIESQNRMVCWGCISERLRQGEELLEG